METMTTNVKLYFQPIPVSRFGIVGDKSVTLEKVLLFLSRNRDTLYLFLETVITSLNYYK